MTKKQRSKLLKIIRADCKTTGVLLNMIGNTCAVGAIALAAGVPKARLKGRAELYWEDYQLVDKKFGLTQFDIADIAKVNDSKRTVAARRKAVAAFIKFCLSLTPHEN